MYSLDDFKPNEVNQLPTLSNKSSNQPCQINQVTNLVKGIK